MNTSEGGQQPQKAGAGAFGGHNNPVPAQFTAGAVGFGPMWQDDATTLQELYDKACQSIVRLECEADELRAEVALLREERAIILRDATKQALKVGAVKSHWIAAYQERDLWRKCAEMLAQAVWQESPSLRIGSARHDALIEFDRLKEASK